MAKHSIDEFGKDHWSTFAYIETCCVDHKGIIEFSRMRTNEKTHPFYKDARSCSFPWAESNGTRLKSYFQDNSLIDPEHDDWDCIDDLIDAGLLEWNGTGANPVFKLTKLGIKVAAKLREHKANGGYFANFEWSEENVLN